VVGLPGRPASSPDEQPGRASLAPRVKGNPRCGK
jgi:hypothetical protein